MSFEKPKIKDAVNEKETKFLGNIKVKEGGTWTESVGRPLEKGENHFFHSTYAYNISPEQYKQLIEEDEFILDQRMFVDTLPQLGYGSCLNPEMRKYKDNPDELVLMRIIAKDQEPFTKIQKEGLDLKSEDYAGSERRFDPRFLGYNLKLKKIGEERMENYRFPHRVITYETAERIPLEEET